MNNHIKHGIVLTVIGVIVFVGVGAVVTKVNCGMGPTSADDYESDAYGTPARNDDQSFFSLFVCTGSRLKHNR